MFWLREYKCWCWTRSLVALIIKFRQKLDENMIRMVIVFLHEISCSECDQNKSVRQNHGKMALTCWEKDLFIWYCPIGCVCVCLCVLFFIRIFNFTLDFGFTFAHSAYSIFRSVCRTENKMRVVMESQKHVDELKIQNDVTFLCYCSCCWIKLLEFVPDQRVTLQTNKWCVHGIFECHLLGDIFMANCIGCFRFLYDIMEQDNWNANRLDFSFSWITACKLLEWPRKICWATVLSTRMNRIHLQINEKTIPQMKWERERERERARMGQLCEWTMT